MKSNDRRFEFGERVIVHGGFTGKGIVLGSRAGAGLLVEEDSCWYAVVLEDGHVTIFPQDDLESDMPSLTAAEGWRERMNAAILEHREAAANHDYLSHTREKLDALLNEVTETPDREKWEALYRAAEWAIGYIESDYNYSEGNHEEYRRHMTAMREARAALDALRAGGAESD